ncbi:MAG: LacI family DNA-binding transcriptional regulator [Armatimonadetes bacterium]|nr:LacI family DNA-binding transcriptional regulator [Armatimonadota bacterium]
MAVTLKDVAREAGVAISTASRALSGAADPITSTGTRERVREVARRLKYRYNLHARCLRTGRSETVGILACDLGQRIGLAKLLAVEAAVREKGYRTLLRYRHQAGLKGRQLGFAQEFASSEVEGAIVINVDAEHSGPLGALIQRGIPVVSLEPLEGVPADVVTVDRMAGAYLLTKHLLDLGHRRIGLLCSSLTTPGLAERHWGYQQALAECGCSFDEAVFARLPSNVALGTCVRGYEAARELLARRPLPTAVFCSNDEVAFGAMKALAEAGLRVPEDMAVVGFDDIEMAAFAPVPLTTVRQPVGEQATQAVALLFERIANPDDERPPRAIRLKPRLVVRASSGGPVVVSDGRED